MVDDELDANVWVVLACYSVGLLFVLFAICLFVALDVVMERTMARLRLGCEQRYYGVLALISYDSFDVEHGWANTCWFTSSRPAPPNKGLTFFSCLSSCLTFHGTRLRTGRIYQNFTYIR